MDHRLGGKSSEFSTDVLATMTQAVVGAEVDEVVGVPEANITIEKFMELRPTGVTDHESD